jgi:hypothetical protein
MYEYTALMSPTAAILSYLLTFIWIAFNWFYIRPKTIRKQESQLNEMIERFEKIAEGF